jgi:hypothetical protein
MLQFGDPHTDGHGKGNSQEQMRQNNLPSTRVFQTGLSLGILNTAIRTSTVIHLARHPGSKIGVGIAIARDPLLGPGRALASASGSYRG